MEATQRLEEMKHLWSSVTMTNAFSRIGWVENAMNGERSGQDHTEEQQAIHMLKFMSEDPLD